MTLADLHAILPIALLAVTAVAVMLSIAFRRSHAVAAVLSLVGLIASLIAVPGAASEMPRPVTPLIVIDGYALFFMSLLLVATLAVVLLSYSYLEQYGGHCEEFYILLILATLGAVVMVVSNHFASFFLGLEVLSVALYGLITYLRTREWGIEAGLKYLILAAASAAFLLFGMALVYAVSGTMELDRIASLLFTGNRDVGVLLRAGAAMIVVGVGFKLGVVPFHMWTPDVYQGAPAPIAAFLATVSKGAVFVLALRFLGAAAVRGSTHLAVPLAAISIASMFVGNLLALLQTCVKRILAYSSIAHLGYLLVAFLAGGDLGIEGVSFYLTAYFSTILGAFGVVTVLSSPDRDADTIEDYRGLFWRRPWLAGLFTVQLLSLAGIPLTAGFVAKFYVLAAGVGAYLWLMVIALVVSSVIGLYYYLRLIVTMFLPVLDSKEIVERVALTWAEGTTLAVLGAIVLWLGVYPGLFIDVIQSATVGFWGQ